MFSVGFGTSHERNENSSPPSSMLTHQQQHQQHQQQQQHQQHSQSGNQSSAHHPNNNMSYNSIHMTSIHKNMTSTAPSGGYHIQNMKEEPNTGSNHYSNMVNGATQEDMAVSSLHPLNSDANFVISNAFSEFTIDFIELYRISVCSLIPDHMKSTNTIRFRKTPKLSHRI